MLDALWRLLDETWPLGLARARLRVEIEDDALTWLERCGCSNEVPLNEGDPYPCLTAAAPGCAMKIVREGGLVAVCTLEPSECADETIDPPDDVQVLVTEDTLVPMIQRAVGVDQRRERGLEVIHLGGRRFGTKQVDFVLAPRPESAVARTELDRFARADPDRVLVVLVFHRQDLPASPPVGGPRVQWMALSDAHPLYRGIALDLMSVWDAFAPGVDPESDVWPRYLFAADPARFRFRYAGELLDLGHRPQLGRLLVELLRKPGKWVSRQELLPEIWPEDFGGRGAVPLTTLGNRLRTAKSELSIVFRKLTLPSTLRQDPIETAKSVSDTEGGYRINVRSSQIRWLSTEDG